MSIKISLKLIIAALAGTKAFAKGHNVVDDLSVKKGCAGVSDSLQRVIDMYNLSTKCDLLEDPNPSIEGTGGKDIIDETGMYHTGYLKLICEEVCSNFDGGSGCLPTAGVEKGAKLFGECGLVKSEIEIAFDNLTGNENTCKGVEAASFPANHLCCQGLCSQLLDCPINCGKEACEPYCCNVLSCPASYCGSCAVGACTFVRQGGGLPPGNFCCLPSTCNSNGDCTDCVTAV